MVFAGRNGGEPVARRGSRIDEFLDTGMTGAFEHADRALDVGVHVLRRLLDRGHDVADAGEMEDVLRANKDRRTGLERTDVLPVAGKIGVALVVLEVAAMSADQVIDDADAKARRQQGIDHVAADEPCTTSNNRRGLPAHAAFNRLSKRTL